MVCRYALNCRGVRSRKANTKNGQWNSNAVREGERETKPGKEKVRDRCFCCVPCSKTNLLHQAGVDRLVLIESLAPKLFRALVAVPVERVVEELGVLEVVRHVIESKLLAPAGKVHKVRLRRVFLEAVDGDQRIATPFAVRNGVPTHASLVFHAWGYHRRNAMKAGKKEETKLLSCTIKRLVAKTIFHNCFFREAHRK